MRRWVSIIAGGLLLAPLVWAQSPISAITDPLRTLTNDVAQFDFITRLVVLLVSLALAFVAVRAWKRGSNETLQWIALAFLLFSLKYLLKMLDLFVSPGYFFTDAAENVIELLALGVFAYVIFFRKPAKGNM